MVLSINVYVFILIEYERWNYWILFLFICKFKFYLIIIYEWIKIYIDGVL